MFVMNHVGIKPAPPGLRVRSGPRGVTVAGSCSFFKGLLVSYSLQVELIPHCFIISAMLCSAKKTWGHTTNNLGRNKECVTV